MRSIAHIDSAFHRDTGQRGLVGNDAALTRSGSSWRPWSPSLDMVRPMRRSSLSKGFGSNIRIFVYTCRIPTSQEVLALCVPLCFGRG